MFCSNCGESMQVITRDAQTVLHCSNCGGSFFEENSINRISEATASSLAEDKQTDEVSGKEKKCPKDQSTLKTLMEDSIPQNVTLLSCAKCKGIFTFADDLVRFKTAQDAKVSYFRSWQKPLPSLSSVLVLSFTAIVSLSLFGGYLLFQKSLSSTNASDQIQSLNISKNQRYVFISFRTANKYSSRIVFTDTSVEPISSETKTISEKPNNIHYIVVTSLPLLDKIYYQIILTDQSGKDLTPLPPPKELLIQ